MSFFALALAFVNTIFAGVSLFYDPVYLLILSLKSHCPCPGPSYLDSLGYCPLESGSLLAALVILLYGQTQRPQHLFC